MNIWEQPQVADQLDQYLSNPDDMDTTLSMVPSLFGISDKATYLGFRSLGLTAQQSLEVMGLPEDYLEIWTEDPYFFDFEYKNLGRLQKHASTEIIRLGFLKNMALFVAKDAKIIRESLTRGLDALSQREFKYLVSVRSHYTPSDMYSLEKALNPEAHKDNVVINLSWGVGMETPPELIEGVEAQYKLLEGGHDDTERESTTQRIPLSDQAEGNDLLVLPEADQVLVPS